MVEPAFVLQHHLIHIDLGTMSGVSWVVCERSWEYMLGRYVRVGARRFSYVQPKEVSGLCLSPHRSDMRILLSFFMFALTPPAGLVVLDMQMRSRIPIYSFIYEFSEKSLGE